MPTYSYACKDCGVKFDIVQSFTDPTLTQCPECSGALRKLFNSVGVVFKGSGFYRNDSRSTGTSSEAASNGKSESKPDSKPEAKPAASEKKADTAAKATTATSSAST